MFAVCKIHENVRDFVHKQPEASLRKETTPVSAHCKNENSPYERAKSPKTEYKKTGAKYKNHEIKYGNFVFSDKILAKFFKKIFFRVEISNFCMKISNLCIKKIENFEIFAFFCMEIPFFYMRTAFFCRGISANSTNFFDDTKIVFQKKQEESFFYNHLNHF